MSILKISARQIIDSRGIPTVEADVVTHKGLFRASVPAGRVKSKEESVELRDCGKEYLGQGVTKAVHNINKLIAPALIRKGLCVTEQHAIDEFMVRELDGTLDKSHLGANAIIAVSLAVVKAGAAEKNLPLYRYVANLSGNKTIQLPVPSFTVLTGGILAGNKLAPQAFMLMPTGAATFAEALRMGTETYHHLKNIICRKYGIDYCNVGDDGAFSPPLSTPVEALDLLTEAISQAGYLGKLVICMNMAGSDLRTKDGKYNLHFKEAKQDPNHYLTGDKFCEFHTNLIRNYPIASVEDPFDKEDWDSWIKFSARSRVQVVGDDLLATNPCRMIKAIQHGACNALLLKISQLGSFSEALETCQMAKRANWRVIFSHREGETEDTTIADLAVGFNCGQIKTGAPCRSERSAKYNQLLRIEEELGCHAQYAGDVFKVKSIC